MAHHFRQRSCLVSYPAIVLFVFSPLTRLIAAVPICSNATQMSTAKKSSLPKYCSFLIILLLPTRADSSLVFQPIRFFITRHLPELPSGEIPWLLGRHSANAI